jgi:hypothetical protein
MVKRMAFKLVICPPNYQDHWPELLRQEIPDIDVEQQRFSALGAD